MAGKSFNIDIVTPDTTVFSGEVTRFSAPSVDGYFEILYNHTPFLAALKIGIIALTDGEKRKKYFAVSGGFAEVYDNRVIVLAEAAEFMEKIDMARVQASKERALKRLAGKSPEVDVKRAQIALLRALNRISVAEKK
ncbi:F0F1 ATP synthase subunit epsilon [bacterium]|nr:F0F1 ATP synthase subunit epsilon [bacterium]